MAEHDGDAGTETTEEAGRDAGDAGRDRNARERVSEGFARGLGVLSAFKEALEETISEARERGDLSVDRAKEAMKGAVGRAKEATTGARDRFDFVTQAEFAALVRRVRELEERMGVVQADDEVEPPEGEDGS